MRRKQQLASILVFVLLSTACIHKTAGTVTPWERVDTYNAALAQANNTFEQGAEAVVSSGLMSVPAAAPLIGLSGQIALLHQQITAILAQGSATTANIASVQNLVGQIQAALAALPPAALGIKNPKSLQTFQLDVQSLGTLATSVLTALQAAQGVTP